MTDRLSRSRDDHDRFRLLAAAAVDGRLDPDSAAELEAHLASCPACRADHAAMLADHAWLAAPAAAILPRAEVRTFVLEAARAPRVPRVSDTPRSLAPLFAAAAAVFVVAMVGLGLAFRPGGSGGVPSASPIPTSSPTASPTAAAPVGRCRSIPAGLTARWTFDDPGERLSGSPLLLAGEARFGEGISGSALELRGPASEARAGDTSVGQLGTDDFTVSVWILFAHTVGEQVLVERFVDGSHAIGWTLTKLETGELRLAVATDRGSFNVDTVGAGLTPEVWHHVGARRLGPVFSLWVDGRLAGTAQLAVGQQADLLADLPLLFGRRADDRGFHLDGRLDELLIWSGRGLTEAELVDVRRAGTDGFCEAAAGAGYEGDWHATDCAASAAMVDCARWGDTSALRLTIGPGERPTARYEDASVPGCGAAGAAGPRVATGTGRFEGVHLWLTFTEVTCTAPSESWANPFQLYKPFAGTDLWFDPDGDGWGTAWQPA